MTGLIKTHKWMLFVMAFFIVVTIAACGSKKQKPTVKIEPPPDIYTDAGIKLLEQGMYDDAGREFTWALMQNEKNSRALTGQALVMVYRGDYKDALDSLKDGCKYARHDEEKLFCRVSRIRIYTVDRRDRRWFLETKEAFADALKIDPRSSAAYFYMGHAYKEHLNFDDAGKMFQEVIAINDRHVKEAEGEVAQIRQIQQAMAVSKTGRNIATSGYITRGDCAALLMEEIKLGKILAGGRDDVTTLRTGKNGDRSRTFSAKDISDHPQKVYIEEILRIGVTGLTKYPDGSFRPEECVNRATYAVIMEDVLSRLTGKNDLREQFEDHASPFADVSVDNPDYEVVMVVTSRGIMDFKDATKAEFAPLAPVSGAEALSVIRKLKEDLDII
ncbi:MAG: S-layer homology domain-containing protein [Syntrophaceae bacterium]|nr:S-layer homology domain-containing protein [Syntrophaceae bacterium]